MDGHINLLQPEFLEVGGEVSAKKGFLSLIIVVMVLVLFGYYFQDQKRGEELRAEVETLRRERDQLLRRVEAVSPMGKPEVTRVSPRLDPVRINRILKERVSWSRILKEFSFIIPKGIWITEMKNTDGEGVRISGFSQSHNKVTEMISSMETSRFFKDVNLEFSRRNGRQDRFDFSIHSGIRGDHSQGLEDG
ncbi:MAG: PilN domain-containing protein [Nitrospiria bacterium]